MRAIGRDTGAAWPEGYTSEVNLGLAGWLQRSRPRSTRGVLLFVDYGLPRREYYAPERRDGTLLCHFRHRFHDDPFARPGLQDITAWVDFTAVAEAGCAAGLQLAGFTTQAHFLIGCGLGEFLADVTDLDVVSASTCRARRWCSRCRAKWASDSRRSRWRKVTMRPCAASRCAISRHTL